MEATESGVHLEIGEEVACLLGDGRLRNTTLGTVISEAPLWLEARKAEVPKLECPRNVILLRHHQDRYLRGEAQLMSIDHSDVKAKLELSKVVWEDVNRRRFPRVEVRLSVSLRAVYETKDETVISVVDGVTKDLSVGGSRVSLNQPIVEGSLVEFYAHLNDQDSVRALGVVAHIGSEGHIGIAFLDYVGGARSKIEEFLLQQAA